VEKPERHCHNVDASLQILLECQSYRPYIAASVSRTGLYKLVECDAVCKPPLVLLLESINQVIDNFLPVTVNCFKLEQKNKYIQVNFAHQKQAQLL
jgi:hypothetical protein